MITECGKLHSRTKSSCTGNRTNRRIDSNPSGCLILFGRQLIVQCTEDGEPPMEMHRQAQHRESNRSRILTMTMGSSHHGYHVRFLNKFINYSSSLNITSKCCSFSILPWYSPLSQTCNAWPTLETLTVGLPPLFLRSLSSILNL